MSSSLNPANATIPKQHHLSPAGAETNLIARGELNLGSIMTGASETLPDGIKQGILDSMGVSALSDAVDLGKGILKGAIKGFQEAAKIEEQIQKGLGEAKEFVKSVVEMFQTPNFAEILATNPLFKPFAEAFDAYQKGEDKNMGRLLGKPIGEYIVAAALIVSGVGLATLAAKIKPIKALFKMWEKFVAVRKKAKLGAPLSKLDQDILDQWMKKRTTKPPDLRPPPLAPEQKKRWENKQPTDKPRKADGDGTIDNRKIKTDGELPPGIRIPPLKGDPNLN